MTEQGLTKEQRIWKSHADRKKLKDKYEENNTRKFKRSQKIKPQIKDNSQQIRSDKEKDERGWDSGISG